MPISVWWFCHFVICQKITISDFVIFSFLFFLLNLLYLINNFNRWQMTRDLNLLIVTKWQMIFWQNEFYHIIDNKFVAQKTSIIICHKKVGKNKFLCFVNLSYLIKMCPPTYNTLAVTWGKKYIIIKIYERFISEKEHDRTNTYLICLLLPKTLFRLQRTDKIKNVSNHFHRNTRKI